MSQRMSIEQAAQRLCDFELNEAEAYEQDASMGYAPAWTPRMEEQYQRRLDALLSHLGYTYDELNVYMHEQDDEAYRWLAAQYAEQQRQEALGR